MRLLVNGASWCVGEDFWPPYNWTMPLAAVHTVDNLAISGASIDRVARTTIEQMANASYDHVIIVLPAIFSRREIVAKGEFRDISIFIVEHRLDKVASGPEATLLRDFFLTWFSDDWNFYNSMCSFDRLVLYLRQQATQFWIFFDDACGFPDGTPAAQSAMFLYNRCKRYVQARTMCEIIEGDVGTTLHPTRTGHDRFAQYIAGLIG